MGNIVDNIMDIFGAGSGSKNAEAIKNAANTSAEAARVQAEIAGQYALRAQELANQGNRELAELALEQARAESAAAIEMMKEAARNSQMYLDQTLGNAEPEIRKAQEQALGYLDEFGDKSADLYRPYIGVGKEAMTRYQDLVNRGVTLRGGQMVKTTTTPGTPKSYDEWKSEKLAGTPGLNYTGGSQRFNEETGQYEGVTDEQLQAEYQQYAQGVPGTTTTTTEETPYDIEKSPYYPLYQYQKEQQQKSIDANLSSRGLYRSGKGIGEQVAADTGLTESFAATEYQRAVDDYSRQIAGQGALMGLGYEASGNLANIYSSLGANKANVSQWAGGSLANLQTQVGIARANAAMGQGTQMAQISSNLGNQSANIYGQLGQSLSNNIMNAGLTQSSQANQLGGTLANIYMNLGNQQSSLYNQQAQNRTNMFSGAANTALYSYMRGNKNTVGNTGYTGNYNYEPYNSSSDYYDYGGGGGGGDFGGSYSPDYYPY